MLSRSDSTASPSEVAPSQDYLDAASPIALVPTENAVRPAAVQPSACGCQAGSPQLVYTLGQLGYDLVSEARLDSLAQTIAGVAGTSRPGAAWRSTPGGC